MWRRIAPCWSCESSSKCFSDCQCARCVNPDEYMLWKLEDREDYEDWLDDQRSQLEGNTSWRTSERKKRKPMKTSHVSPEALARIKEAKKKALYYRLLKGSAILGILWMAGLRCARGWARDCSCRKRSDFCDAKLHWVNLFDEWSPKSQRVNDGSTESKWQVVEDMTVRMFRTTALTAVVQLPSGHKIRVGADGTGWETITDLGKLQDNPKELAEAVKAVGLFQKIFTWKP